MLTRPIYSGLGQILTFHKIRPVRADERIYANAKFEITPEHLEEIIHFFQQQGYHFISSDDLPNILSHPQCQRNVVFTFDDGYLDNLVYAYPILKKHNIPFTLFITTNLAERKPIILGDLLEILVLSSKRLVVPLGEERIEFYWDSATERENVYRGLRSLLLGLDPGIGSAALLKLMETYHLDIYKILSEVALSWEQIKLLDNDPLVTIGSHSAQHPMLTRLTLDAARSEIVDSKNILETHLNHDICHFSYPFGEAGVREYQITKDAGFITAMTTEESNIFPNHYHCLECLPRWTIYNGTNVDRLTLFTNGLMTFLHHPFHGKPLFKCL
jgi:peptidoglycan/xylan/chitin deacetylase (PgdA/CDA1 family)